MQSSDSANRSTHVGVVRAIDGTVVGAYKLCKSSSGSYYIDRKCKRMYYDEAVGTFVKEKVTIDLPVNMYFAQSQKGLSQSEAASLSPNSMDIPVPDFFDLFKEHVIEPFFVFQVFCVLLWLLDEYWNYALLTLFMLILLEAQMVNRRIKDLTELRNMKPPVQKVRVKRDGRFRDITSDQLVHGDTIQIQPSETETLIPADIVITAGSVLVNESMLTGESVPVLKEAIVASDQSNLDINGTHRHSVLFAGSTIVSGTMLTGIVLRTGFHTSQGKLIRTILFASDRVNASSKEAYKFILILFCVALIAAGYVLFEGLEDSHRGRRRRPFKLFLSISHIITSVIPPEFPITMSLTVTLSLVHLIRNLIFCTEPFRIPLAGRISTCCFDKTGTLTSTEMVFENLIVKDDEKRDEAQLVLAACNSLTFVGTRLVGDPIEIAGYTGCCVPAGWMLKNSSTVIRGQETWRIESKFPFDASVQRMSVIVTNGEGKSLVLVKGSPERVRELLAEVPADYDKTCSEMAGKGLRVLALAVREKLEVAPLLDRMEVEKDLSLKFVGFVTFSYSIKPYTIRSIESLQQSGHRCVMVTGDHFLTAIHVAKQVGILKDDSYSVVRSTDDIGKIIVGEKMFCVEGDPGRVVSAGLAERVAVWARATPKDKQTIVASLSEGGKFSLFCGDGTNDVAALKQASVGIALMCSSGSSSGQSGVVKKLKNSGIVAGDSSLPSKPGDASIAAPFAYRGDTIRCVPLLIRSGRAALALVVQNYKILAVNSLITAFCLSVLTLRGVKLGDTQTAIEALFLSLLSFMISRSPPAKSLPTDNGKFKPVCSVFQLSVMVSIFGQAFLHLGLLAYGQFVLTPVELTSVDLDKKFEPSIPNTVAFLQLWAAHLSSSIANFEGPPSLPSLNSSRPVVVLIVGMAMTIFLLASGLLPGDFLELVDLDTLVSIDLMKLLVGHLVGGVAIGYSIRKFFERP